MCDILLGILLISKKIWIDIVQNLQKKRWLDLLPERWSRQRYTERKIGNNCVESTFSTAVSYYDQLLLL